MQPFNLGDPVTCLVYGDGHICEFDELTDNALAMFVSFGFQPDSIPYTFDGRLHHKANITLRHSGSQSLQEMMVIEGSAIPDKVAYLQSNGWQSYKHHDNWVNCNWSKGEKDNSFLDLNSAYERCVKSQEGCIRHKPHFQPFAKCEPFKIGDLVTCDINGNGKVVDFNYGEPDSLVILVKFGFNHLPLPYTEDGRPNKHSDITLHHMIGLTPSKPVSELFKDFRYAIGTDCWMVKKGYGFQLYRCFIAARILEEESLIVKKIYRVRLEGTPTLVEACEEEIFDTLTGCNDALSAYSDLLQKQNS